ncbi:hypothetical protein FRB95_011921 [Tulasnella sp. JGI-2019a]|nr:hypothetical protein FRB95_011921 [Tulasnella sp. JGI-2019a]
MAYPTSDPFSPTISTTATAVPSLSNASTATLPIFDDDAEQQPLLSDKRTPLPKKQLAIICLCRLAEPIAYTQIFPYINQMVEELHVTEKQADIGFYSGVVDGLFAFAQLCTVFQWGRLSDRIGRRPVVMCGLAGGAIASSCFGLSTNIWHMLIFRAMAGGLTGNVAVIQSILGEITDETNQGRAFPLAEVTWSIGSIIGPLIGGNLSHPTERYPTIFGNVEFLVRHPFFLPCFVSSCISLCGILFSFFFLDETLPSKVALRKEKSVERAPLLRKQTQDAFYGAITNCVKPAESTVVLAPSITTLLLDYRMRQALIVGFLHSFSGMAWETVFVLFAYTPAALGGLEQSPSQIALFLSAIGAVGIFLCMFAFPILHHRFGTVPLYRACMMLWPIVFALFCTTSLLNRWAIRQPGNAAQSLTWTGVTLILSTGRVAVLAYATHMIVIKEAAPNKEALGATFGLSLAIGCSARAVSQPFVSSLFAYSIDRQILGGQFVWIVMFGIAVSGYISSRRL